MLTVAKGAGIELDAVDVTDKERSMPGRKPASRPLHKKPQGSRRLVMCVHTQYLRADKSQFDGDSLDMRGLECTWLRLAGEGAVWT